MSVGSESPRESVVRIRKKLFGPGFAVLVMGVALVVFGYLMGQKVWIQSLGCVGVAYGAFEIALSRFRDVLWVAPWGIGYRRNVFGRRRDYPRDRITGWSEEDSHVVIRVTGAPKIKISLADLRLTDAHRLTNTLRECGYEHLGLMYGGV